VLDPPEDLVAVLCVPEVEVATSDARRVLPTTVSMEDAVFTVGRATLLVASLSEGCYELLREAARDRLHQPHRIGLLPAMGDAIEAALGAGALSAWVSGSGSTVLSLCRRGDETLIEAVGAAMAEAFDCRTSTIATELASVGARVTIDEGGGNKS
jgi:homoserine kinase